MFPPGLDDIVTQLQRISYDPGLNDTGYSSSDEYSEQGVSQENKKAPGSPKQKEQIGVREECMHNKRREPPLPGKRYIWLVSTEVHNFS